MQYRRIVLSLTAASVAEIFNKLIPFLMLHLSMRRLGVEGFGQGQYLFWLIDLFSLVVVFGYNQFGPIALGQAGSRSDGNQVLTSIILGKAINAGLLMVGLWFWATFRQQPDLSWVGWSAVGMAIFFTTVDMSFGQVATAQLSTYSAASIVGKIVGLLGVYLLVNEPGDAEMYALCLVVSNAVITSISIYVVLKRFQLTRISWKELGAQMGRAFAFAPSILLMVTIERFDLFFVERWFGIAATGQYSAASRLVQAVLPLITMVGNVFLAEMVQLRDPQVMEKHLRVSLNILVAAVAPVVVGVIIFAGPVIELIYQMQSAEMALLLQVLTIALVGHCLYYAFGVQYLPLKGRIHQVNVGLLWSAVMALGSCFFLRDHATPLVIAGISAGARCMLGIWCALLARSYLSHSVAPLMIRAAIPALVAGIVAICFRDVWMELAIYFVVVGALSGAVHRHTIAKLLTRARRQLISR